MTTAIAEAMKAAISKAPAALPLKPLHERLWLYIKDHPGTIAKDMQAIYKDCHAAHISATLRDFREREMVVCTKKAIFVRGNKGSLRQHLTDSYEVHPKMHGEYELLPRPVKVKPRRPSSPPAPVLAAPIVAVEQHTTAQVVDTLRTENLDALIGDMTNAINQRATGDVLAILDNLKVSEARALYAELKRMFG